MHLCLYLIVISILRAKSIDEEHDDDIKLFELDVLLFDLDNVIDNNLKWIPNDVLLKCQIALIYWSIEGREDTDYPPSTRKHHVYADLLIEKLREIYVILDETEFDEKYFIRDLFTIEEQWIVCAIQYYSFNDRLNDSIDISKYIQWNVYWNELIDDNLISIYYLERIFVEGFEYIYLLERKGKLSFDESLISFQDYFPSYMELKTLIIDDITDRILSLKKFVRK